MKRIVTAINLPDAVPAEITGAPPALRLVSPRALYVEDIYQRGLSDRSIRLIRTIVEEWSWAAFKPPIVVEHGDILEVIDGQHTAIGAATHGGILEIPVLIVQASDMAGRATAFVRHNRDRIQVTPTQLHTAMVAAGDEEALTIDQVCERAKVRILRNPPPMGRYALGDTVAITTIRALVNRRYAVGARRVLELCVQAGGAPISSDLIKAIDYLLFADEYRNEIEAERIAQIAFAMAGDLIAEAKRFAIERKMPVWRAMASVIFMNKRRFRHG